MKFILCKESNGASVYINTELIIKMRQVRGFTFLLMTDGSQIEIIESPEYILSTLEEREDSAAQYFARCIAKEM